MKKPELLVFGIDGASPVYIREQIEQGNLPAFAKVIKRSVQFSDCMAAFPSITPTCWSTISTGAVPAVHGALCEKMHKNGEHPLCFLNAYNGDNIHAERFWEAAARIGKRSLIAEVPSSGPAKCDNVLQIMGGLSVDTYGLPSANVSWDIPRQVFSNAESAVSISSDAHNINETWKDLYGDCSYVQIRTNVYRFLSRFPAGKYHAEAIEEHSWTVLCTESGVQVGIDEASAEAAPVLRPGEWSDFITRRLLTDEGIRAPFHFRARCDQWDPASQTFTVCITTATNIYRYVAPRSLAEEIGEIPGVYAGDTAALSANPPNLDYFFFAEQDMVRWQQNMIAHCLDKYEPDIVFAYYGRIDTLNHIYRSTYEGLKSRYPEDYNDSVRAFREGYELVDRHLAWLLEHVADENTTIVLVSDHASVGCNETVDPWKILSETGLLTFLEGGTRKNLRVDWEHTRAYPVNSCHINVNLCGREPCGIVPPEEYEKTVTEIITVLQKHGRSADGSIPALAFAVPGDQAGFVGQGGENCGDVVYGLIGSRVGGWIGNVHSHQIPSARSKTGDIRPLWTICGPKFKEGVSISRPTDLTDIAPTICYAMGYPQPKDATGGIVFQAFKDNER